MRTPGLASARRLTQAPPAAAAGQGGGHEGRVRGHRTPFVTSFRDGIKSQLQLMADVRDLEAAPESEIEDRRDALLAEHHDDPQYSVRLRKAVVSKLESERRIVEETREAASSRGPHRSTGDHTADKMFRHVTEAFASSREKKVGRLGFVLDILNESDPVIGTGAADGRGNVLIGPDFLTPPEPPLNPPMVLTGDLEETRGRKERRSGEDRIHRLRRLARDDRASDDRHGDWRDL